MCCKIKKQVGNTGFLPCLFTLNLTGHEVAIEFGNTPEKKMTILFADFVHTHAQARHAA